MCLEDIKIGRASRSYVVSTVLATTVLEILPEDKNRLAIVIGAPSSGNLAFSTDPNVALLTGVLIHTADTPLILNVKEHGEIVTSKLFGLASAGTPSVAILCSSFHAKEFERRQNGG